MKHVDPTPMLAHARRRVFLPTRAKPNTPAATPQDERWQLLDLVRSCRKQLDLRDRDIAVLRGLLSLMPANPSPDQMVVFGSNRALSERCDGTDERTLRRRIAHLCEAGILARCQSPNGKRFQLRDEAQAVLLTYGIDLSPLFAIASHLEALAEDCRREGLRIKALRSLIRDRLFHAAATVSLDLREEARLSLRRQLTSQTLEGILARLEAEAPRPVPVAAKVSASDSQNDRHIQSSHKESIDSERLKNLEDSPAAAHQQSGRAPVQHEDITVDECMELADTARTMFVARPQSWSEIVTLSANLAPAIGLAPGVVRSAEMTLGRHGCALAILGLVEAIGRIRNPDAYLNTLIRRAQERSFDAVRMFRSLVRKGRTTAAWA